MGGEWDSTNVADGQVAVFTPIALDHESAARLDDRARSRARSRASSSRRPSVVTAIQPDEALDGARARGRAHRVDARRRGRRVRRRRVARSPSAASSSRSADCAGEYADVQLPLFGDHQAQNAAVAIAAVESFLGGGSVRLAGLGRGTTASAPRPRPVACSSSASSRRCSSTPRTTRTAPRRSSRRSTSTSTSTSSRSCFGVLADKDAARHRRRARPSLGPVRRDAPESDRAVPRRAARARSSPIASAPIA